MIRFMMGLSLACLLVGCGESADTDKADTPKDASITAPATDTVVATESTDTADSTDVVTTEEPAQETAAAELTTVKFKVPGMT